MLTNPPTRSFSGPSRRLSPPLQTDSFPIILATKINHLHLGARSAQAGGSGIGRKGRKSGKRGESFIKGAGCRRNIE
jgi:hypothetical protein